MRRPRRLQPCLLRVRWGESAVEFIIVLAILTLVAMFVTAPVTHAQRARRENAGEQGSDGARIADLEAAREAKYREIRDAELDHRTGKLSDADYEELDRGLRAEAVGILHALDRARAASR